jgi:hypothetical protein
LPKDDGRERLQATVHARCAAPRRTLICVALSILEPVQLLLGDIKFESWVRYRRIQVNDTLETAQQTEV